MGGKPHGTDRFAMCAPTHMTKASSPTQMDAWCLDAVLGRASVPKVVTALVCRAWRDAGGVVGANREGGCGSGGGGGSRGGSGSGSGQRRGARRDRRQGVPPGTAHHARSSVSQALRCVAAGRRDAASCLAWLCARCRMPLPRRLCQRLVRWGALRCLRWAHVSGRPAWDRAVCVAAGRSGRRRVVRWLRSVGNPWLEDLELVATEAACAGRMRLFRWADRHEIASMSYRHVAERAAADGHLAVLRWMHQRLPYLCIDDSVRVCAARGGRLRVLRWMDSLRPARGWNPDVAHEALGMGHGRAFRWLLGRGCPLDDKACLWAAHVTDRRLLVRLRGRGLSWSAAVLTAAASRGSPSMLRWLHAGGCPMTGDACNNAARTGNLRALRWLRGTEGRAPCPWGSDTCAGAARGGHLRTLRWARQNGCPWSDLDDVFAGAATSGHLHVLRWMVTDGDVSIDWRRIERCATVGGQLRVLRWLHRMGHLRLNTMLCYSASHHCSARVLRWLYRAGCPWHHETCIRLAYRGKLCAALWARAAGCPLSERVLGHTDSMGLEAPVYESVTRWLCAHAAPSP